MTSSCTTSRRTGRVSTSPAVAKSETREGRWPSRLSIDATDRPEFHDALLEADSFEDLPGKWQAAIVEAEQNRPKLRLIRDN